MKIFCYSARGSQILCQMYILFCAISANTPNTLDEEPPSICETLLQTLVFQTYHQRKKCGKLVNDYYCKNKAKSSNQKHHDNLRFTV